MAIGLIQPAAMPSQADLFDLPENQHNKTNELMLTMDKINQRFPKGIAVSATQMGNSWQSQVEYKSRNYTTDWMSC